MNKLGCKSLQNIDGNEIGKLVVRLSQKSPLQSEEKFILRKRPLKICIVNSIHFTLNLTQQVNRVEHVIDITMTLTKLIT